MSPTIFISASEASGEHYGELLIEALKKQPGCTRSGFSDLGNHEPRTGTGPLRGAVEEFDPGTALWWASFRTVRDSGTNESLFAATCLPRFTFQGQSWCCYFP
jgi:hypothetical protein